MAAPDIARVQPISSAVQPIGVGLLLLGAGAQVYRYCRVSTLPERQQTKWVVFGVAACIAVFVVIELLGLLVTLVAPSARHSQVTGNLVVGGLFILAITFIPVCIGVAVQDAADPDTVHAHLLAAVHQTLEPAHASVWVRQQ